MPHQSDRPQNPPSPPPGSPGASEATRLLCAGTYLDHDFRDRVIDELYVHEERVAAPAPGFDAARVLAHALRAWRMELAWAGVVLALWIVAVLLTHRLVLIYLLPSLLMVVADRVRGRHPRPPWYRRLGARVLRLLGWLYLLGGFFVLLSLVLQDGDASPSSSFLGEAAPSPVFSGDFGGQEGGSVSRTGTWIALAFPLAMAWVVAVQQHQFAAVLNGELSRTRFPDAASDPAEGARGDRFRRLRDRIRDEQHSPLVVYHSEHPFCGAGTPYEPWSLSVELRARDGEDEPEHLDNRAILRKINKLLEDLCVPSPHGSPQAAASVRDRLRELGADEVVFLPADGLPGRAHAPCGPEVFGIHRAAAVEEGGETRRHFLRVRVGGWEEEVVTTVFVRVHTQGGMLMLEVAPHVLRPVKPLYRHADQIAHQYRQQRLLGRAVRALSRAPASAGRAPITLWRGAGHLRRLAVDDHGRALAQGPLVSVRELGSDDRASLFQEMDVSRYLKSIQDRVANGVQWALHEAGWQTAEFEQKVVNVAAGGIFIGSAKGAVSIGDHNTVTSTTHSTGGSDGKD